MVGHPRRIVPLGRSSSRRRNPLAAIARSHVLDAGSWHRTRSAAPPRSTCGLRSDFVRLTARLPRKRGPAIAASAAQRNSARSRFESPVMTPAVLPRRSGRSFRDATIIHGPASRRRSDSRLSRRNPCIWKARHGPRIHGGGRWPRLQYNRRSPLGRSMSSASGKQDSSRDLQTLRLSPRSRCGLRPSRSLPRSLRRARPSWTPPSTAFSARLRSQGGAREGRPSVAVGFGGAVAGASG